MRKLSLQRSCIVLSVVTCLYHDLDKCSSLTVPKGSVNLVNFRARMHRPDGSDQGMFHFRQSHGSLALDFKVKNPTETLANFERHRDV